MLRIAGPSILIVALTGMMFHRVGVAQEYAPKVRTVGGVTQTIFPPSKSTVDVFRPPEAIYQFIDTNGNVTTTVNAITTNTPAGITNVIRAVSQPSTLPPVEVLKPSDLVAVDVKVGPNAYTLRSAPLSSLISAANPTVINVRMFGALGDGIADDSAAIRAAWIAWTNLPRGGVLYFPAGLYLDTNYYKLQWKAYPGHPGNPEPQWSIRGDGSGATHWASTSTSAGTFIEFTQTGLGMYGIDILNRADARLPKRGVAAVNNTGTIYLHDVSLCYWETGFDGCGSAGGHVYGTSVYGCGVGFRVSGYCDGWTMDLNARRCWNAGLEIGGTNTFVGTTRASGGQFNVFGIMNNIGVVIGKGMNVSVYGYMEKQTNGMVAVGHPPQFGAENENAGIHGLKLSLAGVQPPGQPGIMLYARATSLVLENCTAIGGPDRWAVESQTAETDRTPIKFENHNGLSMRLSTGKIVPVSAKTTYWNWHDQHIGDAPYTVYSDVWSDNVSSNTIKSFRLGQMPWNSDSYRPQSWIFGRINSETSATLNWGGGTASGKPYSEHKFWIGDPSQTGAGSNVFAILPTGLYGNAQGLTNMPGALTTNAANITALSVLPGLQYAERSAATTIGGFQGKWAGFGNKGTLIIKNTSGTDMPVRWPAGTRIQNLRDGSRDCIITNGGIGQFDILYYPDVTTNVLFSNPY